MVEALVTLAKGTIEHVPADIVDTLLNITTLTGTGLKYDIYQEETLIIADVATNNVLMRALPLIDTTTLSEGEYELFLHFDSIPEHPRLGPLKFRVD